MEYVKQRVATKVCLCKPFNVAAFANDSMPFLISAFTVEAAYTSFYKEIDYPVNKVLREPVYVQVEVLEIIDPLVVLTLDHCWTTTSPNPQDLPQWDILINGYLILLFLSLFQDILPKVDNLILPLSRCPNPKDPYLTQLVTPNPPNIRRFFFKMFAFTDILEEASQQVTDRSTDPYIT